MTRVLPAGLVAGSHHRLLEPHPFESANGSLLLLDSARISSWMKELGVGGPGGADRAIAIYRLAITSTFLR